MDIVLQRSAASGQAEAFQHDPAVPDDQSPAIVSRPSAATPRRSPPSWRRDRARGLAGSQTAASTARWSASQTAGRRCGSLGLQAGRPEQEVVRVGQALARFCDRGAAEVDRFSSLHPGGDGPLMPRHPPCQRSRLLRNGWFENPACTVKLAVAGPSTAMGQAGSSPRPWLEPVFS